MDQKDNVEILTNLVQERGIANNIMDMCDDTPIKEFCKDTVNDFFEKLYEKYNNDYSFISCMNPLYKNPALEAAEQLDYDKINEYLDKCTNIVYGDDNVIGNLICTMYKAKIRSYVENRSVSSAEFGLTNDWVVSG